MLVGDCLFLRSVNLRLPNPLQRRMMFIRDLPGGSSATSTSSPFVHGFSGATTVEILQQLMGDQETTSPSNDQREV